MSDSEFGTGTAYVLALILIHEAELWKDLQTITYHANRGAEPPFTERDVVSRWFYTISDHAKGLKGIPGQEAISKEILPLQGFINNRRGFNEYEATIDDAKHVIAKCKDLLIEIDKLLGVPAMRGEFE